MILILNHSLFCFSQCYNEQILYITLKILNYLLFRYKQKKLLLNKKIIFKRITHQIIIKVIINSHFK